MKAKELAIHIAGLRSVAARLTEVASGIETDDIANSRKNGDMVRGLRNVLLATADRLLDLMPDIDVKVE